MYSIGWFSTGRDEAARDLLTTAYEAIRHGTIKAEIAFVFCSRETGESPGSDAFMRLVESYRIPLVCFSYQKFKAGIPRDEQATVGFPHWRLDYDREVMAGLKTFKPELCVLAGYMLIVGPEMCSRYTMINLHPATPTGPTGTWQEVIWQLMAQKATETGVMMHLVTPQLDRGPVVSYCKFAVRGKPFDSYWHQLEGRDIEAIKQSEGENNALFKLIREEGLKREFPLILSTIKAFSEGRVSVVQSRVLDARGNAIKGYDLTREIDRQVKPA